MKKKVIYSGFVREKKGIIKNLKDKFDWNPTVITGTKSDEDWYRNQFKNSLFFDNMDLRNGRFQYSKSIIFNPVGIEVLDKLSKYSLNFFLLLEETSKWNFSMLERQSFYYENINFWNSVLSSSKTDIVVDTIIVAPEWPRITKS